MKLLGLWILPLVLALKRRTEGTPQMPETLELVLGNAAAPSRHLPEKFVNLNAQRINATKLQYLRCDPKAPPLADGERCRPYSGEELHFTPRPLKLVLGVMAMTSQSAIQESHRNTWMKNPGVCSMSQHKDPRCKIFPVFVFGDAGGATSKLADAVTLENVPEPPQQWDGFEDTKHEAGWKRSWWTSQFKTPAWLAYAKQFHWATHVGKMDSDTFPDVLSIMEDLASKPVTRFGEEWPVVYGRHFMGGYNGKGGMFGEFYAISFQLLECFLKEDAKKHPRSGIINGRNSTWGAEWWAHAEDQVLRTTLFHAEEEHVCPKMLDANADRWQHPV